MPLEPSTLTDILQNADEHDIERLRDTIKTRKQTLDAARSANVSVGKQATLRGLSPKYLNGLRGEVVLDPNGRGGMRAFGIRLDKESTDRLRFTRQSRFFVAPGTEEYVLGGIPVQCIEVQA